MIIGAWAHLPRQQDPRLGARGQLTEKDGNERGEEEHVYCILLLTLDAILTMI